jgi:hypothetical protein
MGQHGRRIALLTSELLMGDGGEGHDAVTFLGNSVLVRRSIKSSASLRKVSGAFLIAKKLVEFRSLFCSCQPICNQRGLDLASIALRSLSPLQFVIHHQNIVCNWYFD